MNDYNPYYDDVKERKSVATGAYHKRNGAKSKKCTLPSDNLTAAQRRKLNGPAREWNIKKPMPWGEFKSAPKTVQQLHLDFLRSEFPGLGLTTVSEKYFGLSKPALSNYVKSHHLEYHVEHGRRTPSDTHAKLLTWLGRGGTESAEDASPAASPAVPHAPEFVVTARSADISGPADAVLAYIGAMLCGRDADVRIEIKFKGEVKKNER